MFINTQDLKYDLEMAKHVFHDFKGRTKDFYFSLLEQRALYPQLSKFAQLLFTLPGTSAVAERSFSTMKRFKTYLCSAMMTERLMILSILSIEREESEKLIKNPDEILNIFSSVGQRKLNL